MSGYKILRTLTVLGLFLAFSLLPYGVGNANQSQMKTPIYTQNTYEKNVSLSFSLQNSIVKPSDSESFALIEIKNDSVDTIPAGTVSVKISTEKLSNSNDLNTKDFVTGKEIIKVDIPATQSNTTRSHKIQIPVSNFGLSTLDSGVFSLQATFSATGSEQSEKLIDNAPLVWNVTKNHKTKVAFIVPLLLPPEIETLPGKEDIIRLTAENSPWNKLITAAQNAHATVAVDPRIMIALRGLKNDLPQVSKSFLTKLESPALSKFMLQYADADIAAQAETGLSKSLNPTGISFATEYESEIPTVESTIESSEIQFGADFSLLNHFKQSELTTAWPANGQITDKTLKFATDNGFDKLVIDSNNVTNLNASNIVLDNQKATVFSHQLSEYFNSSFGSKTAVLKAHSLSNALAYLALKNKQNDEVVIALDRFMTATDATKAADAITLFTQSDWVSTVSVDSLQQGTATLIPISVDKVRIDNLTGVLGADKSINDLSFYLDNPAFLIDYQRFRVLHIFSAEFVEKKFDEQHKKFIEQQHIFSKGISFVPTNRVQMLGETSHIPVQITNNLPFDTHVNLNFAESDSLAVIKNPKQNVFIRAGRTNTVFIDVDSRVTSGFTSVEMGVINPKTNKLGAQETLRIDISSATEKIIIICVFISITIFIGFGVMRSRRAYKRTSKHKQ